MIILKDFIVKKNVRKINFKNSLVVRVNIPNVPENVGFRELKLKEPTSVNLRQFLDELRFINL